MATPDRFVLKPQREGGGNNVYGESDKLEIIKLRSCFMLIYLLVHVACKVCRKQNSDTDHIHTRITFTQCMLDVLTECVLLGCFLL